MQAAQPDSSDPKPHWLCVAYAFPPINRSGTLRTLAFVNELDRMGFRATVLTVEPDGETLDHTQATRIPPSTTMIRTPWVDLIARLKSLSPISVGGSATETTATQDPHAGPNGNPGARRKSLSWLREWVSQWLTTPDSRIGWVIPAVRAGLRAIRRDKPEVIYSTSPCVSAHLIALILSRWARLPWVADFRDPWGDNPFRDRTFWAIEKWDSLLEWIVLRGATRVVCNTPTVTQRLIRRRPFVADKCVTILNGFDAQLFVDLVSTRLAPAGHFVLTHAGQFYGPRSPKVWFKAVRRALDQNTELASRLEVVLIGSEVFEQRHLRDWARDAGISQNVKVLGRKTHAQTLSHLAGSDALMLAGAAGPGAELQVPNKLYEYLALRKPILATCSNHSPIVPILERARAQAVVCDPSNEQEIAEAIVRFAMGDTTPTEDAWSGVGRFDRIHRARELADIFRNISARRKCGMVNAEW